MYVSTTAGTCGLMTRSRFFFSIKIRFMNNSPYDHARRTNPTSRFRVHPSSHPANRILDMYVGMTSIPYRDSQGSRDPGTEYYQKLSPPGRICLLRRYDRWISAILVYLRVFPGISAPVPARARASDP